MSIVVEVAVALGAVLVVFIHFLHVLVLRPKSLRAKLHKQGIHGPSPHFYFGNIPQIKTLLLQQQTQLKQQQDEHVPVPVPVPVPVSISHCWTSNLFPHIHSWRKQYGSIYLFFSGSIQWLMVADMEMVKEILLNTSLNLGKPSYLSKDMGPLLGQGILSSSGPIWAHQRKIIAPELYLDKVKAMVDQIVDSTNIMLRSWESRIERDGEVSEIKVDENLRSLSADIISRACFGSNYAQGKEIFTKLRDLQKLLSKISVGVPGFRYFPNKSNRQIWKLEKEINSNISKLVKQCQDEGHEQDLLQMILEGAKNCDDLLSSSISQDRFIIDNCKNIFFAGHETTAVTASWCLMLLATYQDWQDRARAEVLEVCRNCNLDASMLRSMKTLTTVIQETLRLYPPAAFVVRTVFQDINIKGIKIPKGMNIQIPISILQQDIGLWGSDAYKFNPERFANGVLGACKIPQAYMPFGIGARVCAGQHFAMMELKVVLSLVLSKFRFSLSSSYCHSPAFRLVIEPGEGVVLNMTRI